MRYSERPYQLVAERFVLDHKRAGLQIDMGLGKTCVTATVIDFLLALGEIQSVLIVAPKRVAESTWPAEFAKWGHLRDLRYAVLTGDKKKREQEIKRDVDVHVINFELLKWLMAYHGKRWPYDMMVIDEVTRVKNPTALTTRLCRRVCRHVDRLVWLTGTGAPNGLQDLWAPMYLLDQGERLESSVGRFRATYCQPCGFEMREWCLQDDASERIYAQMKDIVLSMKSEDYLELPERVENLVEVDLPESAVALYKQMEDEFFAEIAGENIEAVNAGTKAMKLRQLASGFIFNGDDWHVVHDAKLEALDELITELNGQPTLVAYYFQPDLERILKRFPQAVRLKSLQDIDDWNAGKFPIALVNAASHGHGLNLQDGGHHIIFYSLDWNLDNHMQLRKRLHRSGQKYPVIEHTIEARKTVDGLIRKRLESKRSVQDLLFEALKQR